jgi:hypothetical protein
MDNGLTKSEASEMLTHLLFYAGWPNVFSALTKPSCESRQGTNTWRLELEVEVERAV